jgi:hypothetical protein
MNRRVLVKRGAIERTDNLPQEHFICMLGVGVQREMKPLSCENARMEGPMKIEVEVGYPSQSLKTRILSLFRKGFPDKWPSAQPVAYRPRHVSRTAATRNAVSRFGANSALKIAGYENGI